MKLPVRKIFIGLGVLVLLFLVFYTIQLSRNKEGYPAGRAGVTARPTRTAPPPGPSGPPGPPRPPPPPPPPAAGKSSTECRNTYKTKTDCNKDLGCKWHTPTLLNSNSHCTKR